MVTHQLVELHNAGSSPAVGDNMSMVLYEYIFVVVGLSLVILISFVILTLSYLLITLKKPYNFEKLSSYECGFQPFEDSRHLFNIKFYLIGILFVVFDLEIIFLFPWCVSFYLIGFYGFWVIIIFLIILIIGFFYELEKGALDF